MRSAQLLVERLWLGLLCIGAVACSGSGSDDADGGADAGDADGGTDASVVNDPYPHPCTYARDLQADGIYDWISIYELDDEGRVIRDETDADGDQDVDYLTLTTYDEDGRQTRQTLDQDNDGVVDLEHVNDYRSDGQLKSQIDYDGAGEELHRLEYSYDDDGFLIEMFGYLPSADDHIEHPTRVTLENDDNGCMIGRIQDDHDDGVIEVVSEYEVEEDCHVLLEETDRHDDGVIDLVATYEYDEDGHAISEDFVVRDIRKLLRTTTYEGALKMRVVEERAASSDVTTYEYDDVGNLLRIDDDAFDDGMAITTTKYENDARGNPLYVLIDDHGDGHPDDLAAYTYDCWE